MIRKRFSWKIRDRVVTLGEQTLIMGIVNVTPDSFSDGGRFDDPDSAAKVILEMQEAGADLIDIGAESTRPGSVRVSEGEEIRRLIPVLKRIKGKVDVPISVDTYKPGVAEAALEHGVQVINDVSGLTWEPELGKVVNRSDAGLILNHMRGTPDQWARMAPMRNVMGEIAAELEAAVHRARHNQIGMERIVIDPGIGFGKRKEQNSEIIARLGELRKLMLPILIGPSRKSFLAQADSDLTEFATAGAVAAGILHGAYIVRVHDVRAMLPVVRVVDAVIDATPEPQDEAPPPPPPAIRRPVAPPQPSTPGVRRPLGPPRKRDDRY